MFKKALKHKIERKYETFLNDILRRMVYLQIVMYRKRMVQLENSD